MVDCDQALSSVHQFLAGELRPGVQAEINGHLHGCPDCYQAFDFHGQLRTVIADRARESALPEAFWERLQSRVESELGEEFQQIRDSFTAAMQNVQGGLLHPKSAVFGSTSAFSQRFDRPSSFESSPFEQPSPFDQGSPFDQPSPFRPKQ